MQTPAPWLQRVPKQPRAHHETRYDRGIVVAEPVLGQEVRNIRGIDVGQSMLVLELDHVQHRRWRGQS